MKQIETKLITITRQDIPTGYQIVQTGHSIADFSHDHSDIFKKWKEESNSIICLSANDLNHLVQLYDKFSTITPTTIFFEPDINEFTSLCLYGTPEIRKKLSRMPLAGKKEVLC